MGQMQAGMLAGLVSDWLGVENLREFEVRFVAPVHLGDVLELGAEITNVDPQLATVTAVAQVDGRTVVTASAQVIVIDR
jgi:acyl dehydratase